MSKVKHIAFVCTGNCCRSPMAEGIARRIFSAHGFEYNFSSYGILDLDNTPPSTQALKICAEHGIDISRHRSQVLTRSAAEKMDLILTMERAHIDWIRRNIGEDIAAKTYLLTEYPERSARADEIPDPIGMPDEFYSDVFHRIWREIERIAGTELQEND